ncbi:uncharacterized protein [Palaemon carinicauda]|uniref:uncharacterized protein n=1 Tax=Palaemon carinicauda TaxID=392227 RepID=UPI0035B679EE
MEANKDEMNRNITKFVLELLQVIDDLVLFSEPWKELQKMMEDFNREDGNVGLKMNMSKTNIMFNENAGTTNNDSLPAIKGTLVDLDRLRRVLENGLGRRECQKPVSMKNCTPLLASCKKKRSVTGEGGLPCYCK